MEEATGATDSISLNMSFHGEAYTSHTIDNFHMFETVPILTNDNNGQCENLFSCSNEDAGKSNAAFEFFLMRDFINTQTSGDLTWSLSYAGGAAQDDNNKPMILANNMIGRNDHSIHYAFQCVPKESCLEFNISVPDKKFGGTFSDYGRYQLELGGAIYVDDGYAAAMEVGGPYSMSTTSMSLGHCHIGHDICDAAQQALLDVSVQSDGQPKVNDIRWFVYGHDKYGGGGLLPDYWTSSMPSVYFANVTYRRYECIPIHREDCVYLEMFWSLNEGTVLEYSVHVDEDLFPDGSTEITQVHGKGGAEVSSKRMTTNGRHCNEEGFAPTSYPHDNDLSLKKMIGISICSLLALVSLYLLVSGILSLRAAIRAGEGSFFPEDDETTKTSEAEEEEHGIQLSTVPLDEETAPPTVIMNERDNRSS